MSTNKMYRYVVFIPQDGNIAQKNYRGEFSEYGYRPMAIITAGSIEEVFNIGNGAGGIGDYKKISKDRSVSTGDIVVREDAKLFVYVCESIGWTLHKHPNCYIEETEEILRLMPPNPDAGLIDGFTPEEVRLMKNGDNVGAIESYRERSRKEDALGNMTHMYGLKETKDTVEQYMDLMGYPLTTGIEEVN